MDLVEEISTSRENDDIVPFTDYVFDDSQSDPLQSVSKPMAGLRFTLLPFDAPVTMTVLAMISVLR